MHLLPHMRRGLWLCATLGLTQIAPLAAQENEAEPSFLETFLEDSLSGDNQYITVTGLTGALSSLASIEQITIADAAGVWLELHNAELDWNRLALLRGEFSVNRLTATEIKVLRQPRSLPDDPSLPAPEVTPFQLPELPVSVEVGALKIDRIDLHQDLFGVAARLNLAGSVLLADGSLAAHLTVDRLDRPGDRLTLDAEYTNDSRKIALNLALDEAANGLISTVMNLPGTPSLHFGLAGAGPVEDFNAQIALASNGRERLTGEVVLKALAPSEKNNTDAVAGIGFGAELKGDVDALLHPDYRPFFGPKLNLTLRGSTSALQGTTLDSLSLQTQALTLAGALAITATGEIDTANLRANISPVDGQAAVILPIPGADTTLASAQLAASKTSKGQWAVTANLNEISHPDIRIASTNLQATGTLVQSTTQPLDLDGRVNIDLQMMQPRDAALAKALGQQLQLSGQLTTQGPGALSLADMKIQGTDYQISGGLAIEGLQSGLEILTDLRVGTGNLTRFSDLVQQPLSGALQAQIAGSFTPLSGAFDADLALQAQGMTAGIPELDQLIDGNIGLIFQGQRNEAGLTIKSFRLDGSQISAEAHGNLDSQTGTLMLRAGLKDLSLVVPQTAGPLELTADVTRRGDLLTGVANLKGPHSSHAALDGSVRLNGDADFTFDAALNELERFLPELPGAGIASGQAARRQGIWQINGKAKAPAGAAARIEGSFDETTGIADLSAKGQARLEGINPFITPNLMQGAAQFDLAVKGALGLDALTGTVTTSGASIALPAAAQRIDDIAATVTLARSRAQLQITARPRDGGSLSLSGPLALLPPFNSTLKIGIHDVIVSDHLSYDTVLAGDLLLSGELTGSSLLSGRINVGETNINLNTAGGSISAAPIPSIRHINEPRQSRLTRARAGLIQSASSGGSNSNINLDVLIDAPSRIHARGRGLRSELGGQIRLRGSSAALEPSGQINLIRGTFDVLGRRLDLDEGSITLLGDLKPYLEFKSSANTANGTATLEISGQVDSPVIKVTSEPPRPSEEALALLLFGDDIQNLSPLALARIASSALELSGRGLGSEKKLRDETGAEDVDLGLDNLGAGLLGVGGYVSDNVYTDFNVNTRGDSELSLNLDISKSISVTGTVDSEGETGLGLFFKRDY